MATDSGASTWQNRIVGSGVKSADQFMANPANARQHPQPQRDAVEGSLNELGWVAPVIENVATGYLLDGHERVWQALQHDNAEVPFIQVDLDEAEEKLFLAAFDWITQMAYYDTDQLDALLRDVQTGEAGLQAMLAEMAEAEGLTFGENGHEEADAEPQVNRAEELREAWGVEPGQLWRLPSRTPGQEHRLICGDCTDATTVERVMDGEKWQIAVTSPPYASGANTSGYKTDYYGKTKRFYHHNLDNMTANEWLELGNNFLFLAAEHMEAPESVFVFNVMYNANNRDGYGRLLFAGQHPFTVKETVCWDKGQGFPSATKGILSRNWELVFVLSTSDIYYTTQGQHEVRWAKWDIGRPDEQDETHHAAFPVEFASRAMADFSNRGAVCYEPFSGSGTTIIAAENLSRQCRAVEIAPAYVAVALQRYRDAFGIEPELLTD